MDLALSEWFKFLYEEEDLYGGKKRVIKEYTEEGAKPTFDWMAENGPNFQTEFDDLFDGKMRVAVPVGPVVPPKKPEPPKKPLVPEV